MKHNNIKSTDTSMKNVNFNTNNTNTIGQMDCKYLYNTNDNIFNEFTNINNYPKKYIGTIDNSIYKLQ